QTASNVLCFGGLSRNFGNYVAGADRRIFLNGDIGANRQEVASDSAAAFPADILDGNPWALVAILRFNDNLTGQAGDLIKLLFHTYTFDDITEFDLTCKFGENRHGVGVPFCQGCTLFNFASRGDFNLGAIDDTILLTLTPGIIYNCNLAITVHDDVVSFRVNNRVKVDKLEDT